MQARPWMIPLCLAAICLMILALTGAERLTLTLVMATGIFLVIAAFLAFAGRTNKYDLGALRRVHEREEVLAIEPEEPDEYGSVLCPNCGESYAPIFPTCPRCAKK